jgi:S1-C subfamily serine protease
VNALDALAIALLVIGILLGWRSGALPQLAGLGGAAIGGAIAFWVLPFILPSLESVPAVVRLIAVLGILLGAVGLGEALGAKVGRAGSQLLGQGLLGALDRIAGAAVGAAQSILILWLVGGILATGAVPSLGRAAQGSTALHGIGAVLPPPTELVLELGKALDESGLPDVFLGLERLPAAPVDLPADPIAKALGLAASPSVFRVQADACQFRSTGTSFAIATGYLVTNAHVVAGARSITVESAVGRWPARLVAFDGDLDIALLWVREITATPLIFTPAPPDRGALGATIGYPNGGDAVVEPAAVTASFPAEGLDITGTERVTRRILELRAAIEPGDSGGPLLLTDGTVGGVVFAESRTDEAVGYALNPTDVAIALAGKVGRTAPVDAGPCIH